MKSVLVVLTFLLSAGALADPARDPMRPPSATASGPAPVRQGPPAVSAVFISSARRVAVVRGQLVRAGDQVGACVIEEVREEGLRCREGGDLHLPRTPGSELAMRTPATPPAVALNGTR